MKISEAKKQLDKVLEANISDNRFELIKYFRKTIGQSEIKGIVHNSWIVKLFKIVGATWYSTDETAWCGAYVGAAIKHATGTNPLGWRAVTAKRWLKVGKEIGEVKKGDIAVISRNNGKGHHVAFYWDHNDDYVLLIGGNQNNQVNISAYHESRIISIRDFDSI